MIKVTGEDFAVTSGESEVRARFRVSRDETGELVKETNCSEMAEGSGSRKKGYLGLVDERRSDQRSFRVRDAVEAQKKSAWRGPR